MKSTNNKKTLTKNLVTFFSVILLLLLTNNLFAEIKAVEPTISKFSEVKSQEPSLYTGDAMLSVPLLNVPGRQGFNLPISLSYTSGIKVKDDASWVGLGWNLEEGQISRAVNGAPDDRATYGFLYETTSCQDFIDQNGDILDKCDNGQQDEYYLSFGDQAVSFFLIKDISGISIALKNWKPWKLEYDTAGGEITSWDVTTEDGTVYVFDKIVKSKQEVHTSTTRCESPTSCDGTNPPPSVTNDYSLKGSGYTVAWKLTQIHRPDNILGILAHQCNHSSGADPRLQHCIKIDYTTDTAFYDYNSPRSGWEYTGSTTLLDYQDLDYTVTPPSPKKKYLHNYQKTTSSVQYVYPTTVETMIATATFELDSVNRADLKTASNSTPAKRLKSVSLQYNDSSTVAKKMVLTHDYSLATDCENCSSGQGKLTLTKIQEFGKAGTPSLPATTFTYGYKPSLSGNAKNAQDLWGYYNGWTNNPSVNYPVPTNLSSQNRHTELACSLTCASAWSLNAVTYPSGGQITYMYESDDYYDVQERIALHLEHAATNQTLIDEYGGSLNSRIYGGGIRVRTQSIFDGTSTSTAEFFYDQNGDGTGVSSGVAMAQPKSVYLNPETNDEDYLYVTAFPLSTVGQGSKVYVGYSKVAKKLPGNRGRIVKDYITAVEPTTTVNPQLIDVFDKHPNSFEQLLTSMDWRRGLIHTERAFNSSGTEIQKVEHTYEVNNKGWNTTSWQDPITKNYTIYYFTGGWMPETKTVVKDIAFDESTSSNSTITRTTTYEYNPLNGMVETKTEDFGGVSKTTATNYYFENGDNSTVKQEFNRSHQLHHVFETEVTGSGGVLSYSKNYYYFYQISGVPLYKLMYVQNWIDTDFDRVRETSDTYRITEAYNYDKWGNLTQRIAPSPFNYTFTDAYDSTYNAKPISSCDPQNYCVSITAFDPTYTTQPTTVVDQNGQTITIHYDDFGRPDWFKDQENNQTSFSYDNTNLSWNQITAPVETGKTKTIKSTFDKLGRETARIINGVSTSKEYGLLGEVMKEYLPTGKYKETEYEYSPLLRPTKIYPNKGDRSDLYASMSYKHNTTSWFVKETTEPISVSQSKYRSIREFSDLLGRIGFTNVYGRQTSFSYDDLSNNLTAKQDSDSITGDKVTRYVTNNIGEKLFAEYPDTNYPSGSDNQTCDRTATGNCDMDWIYDKLGRAVVYRDPNLKASTKFISTSYDSLNRETLVCSKPWSASWQNASCDSLSDPKAIKIEKFYDSYASCSQTPSNSYPVGRLTCINNGVQEEIFGYDKRGNVNQRVVKLNGETFTFNMSFTTGKLIQTKTIDPVQNKSATYHYDNFGRVSSVDITGATSVASYQYNDLNQVEYIDMKNGVDSDPQYDNLNRLFKLTTTPTNIDYNRYYEFDDASRILKIHNGNSSSDLVIGDYTYNDMDELTKAILKPLWHPAHSEVVTQDITYDQNGNRKTNKMVQTIDGVSQTFEDSTYSYTQNTSKLDETYGKFCKTGEKCAKATKCGWKPNQNVNLQTNKEYTLNFWAFKGINPDNLVARIVGEGNVTSYLVDCYFTPSGSWIQKSCTFNSGNNTSVKLHAVTGAGNEGDVNIFNYFDDIELKVSGGSNLVVNPGFENGSTGWTMDPNLLIASSYNNYDFAYDNSGNMTSKILKNADGQIITQKDFTYDYLGRMISADGENYSYNAGEKRVLKKDSTGKLLGLYVYEGDDTIFEKHFAGTKGNCSGGEGSVCISDAVCIISFIFAGSFMPDPIILADADGDGVVTISDAVYIITYIFAGGPAPSGAPVYKTAGYLNVNGSSLLYSDTNSKLHFILSDQVNSTSVQTSSSGTVESTSRYYPFGQFLGGGGLPTKGFTGKEKDATGLYYYGARYYDPTLGRFIQRDTFDHKQPYAYVGNNPISKNDPSGHEDTVGFDEWANSRIESVMASDATEQEKQYRISGILAQAPGEGIGSPFINTDLINVGKIFAKGGAMLAVAFIPASLEKTLVTESAAKLAKMGANAAMGALKQVGKTILEHKISSAVMTTVKEALEKFGDDIGKATQYIREILPSFRKVSEAQDAVKAAEDAVSALKGTASQEAIDAAKQAVVEAKAAKEAAEEAAKKVSKEAEEKLSK